MRDKGHMIRSISSSGTLSHIGITELSSDLRGASIAHVVLNPGTCLFFVFRAWSLEKAMHVVEGRGSLNHQVVFGIVLLPIAIAATGEWKFWLNMPYDFSDFYFYQLWLCLVTAGTLPFVKNIVANRLIRKTGQAPWRTLELVCIICVFGLGQVVYNQPATPWLWVAFSLVVIGRGLGMVDVISRPDIPPEVRPGERRPQREGDHARSPPPSSQRNSRMKADEDVESQQMRPDGQPEEIPAGDDMSPPEYQREPNPEASEGQDDVEMVEPDEPETIDEPQHGKARPLLTRHSYR
eukprot:GHVU01047273.1.p2 GENE.GHVU01047273.1~~GHVU01047273.1.p2  ORF type:complete len:294 (+),score=16.00 GHVU01047273.1:2159-3040(+)